MHVTFRKTFYVICTGTTRRSVWSVSTSHRASGFSRRLAELLAGDVD